MRASLVAFGFALMGMLAFSPPGSALASPIQLSASKSGSPGAAAYSERMANESYRLRGEAFRIDGEAERLFNESIRLQNEASRLRAAAADLDRAWKRANVAAPDVFRDFRGRDRSQRRMVADSNQLKRDAHRLSKDAKMLRQEAVRLRSLALAVDAEAQEELLRRFRLQALNATQGFALAEAQIKFMLAVGTPTR